jgi:hypothetical protein
MSNVELREVLVCPRIDEAPPGVRARFLGGA